jgi:hypothetical protein
MLTRQQADTLADEIMREARAGLRRNNPPINLMPLYYRMCPELKQFSQLEAFAIVRAANRSIALRGLGLVIGPLLGVVAGKLALENGATLWLTVPVMVLVLGFDLWRVRREVASLCVQRLPEALAASVDVGEV